MSDNKQNGKGMRPRIGYDYKKYAENWEKIFGKPKEKDGQKKI